MASASSVTPTCGRALWCGFVMSATMGLSRAVVSSVVVLAYLGGNLSHQSWQLSISRRLRHVVRRNQRIAAKIGEEQLDLEEEFL
ncbi:uncharacterized protein M6B38_293015 [Iris pallida]|uniref:Uncharacterized protein n=1 Tax=Iris pallida TaxID=29817 RepID=A0AAX6HUY1_IRIPA|nr:uncharacterized protein M6B38_293015 [Iris pallida]